MLNYIDKKIMTPNSKADLCLQGVPVLTKKKICLIYFYLQIYIAYGRHFVHKHFPCLQIKCIDRSSHKLFCSFRLFVQVKV